MWIEVEEGLRFRELRRSDSAAVGSGDQVLVHYRVALGEVEEGEAEWIDSSWRRKSPFRFTVDAGEVLRGVDRCMHGMTAISERRIIMGPEWAFGSRGLAGTVPGGSPLTIELYVVMIEQVASSDKLVR